MLSILDAYSEVLPPSRTYPRRSFTWIPTTDEYAAKTAIVGNLLTKQQKSKSGVRRKVEVSSYCVERDTPQAGDEGGVAFWVVNTLNPDQEEPYRCVVGGLQPKCGCKAGKCKVTDDEGSLVCKHNAALRHLIAMGILAA